MKKGLILITLLLLISSIFVLAGYFPIENNQQIFSFELNKGWNLVHGFLDVNQITDDSSIDSKDIKAVFGFIPTTQKYIRAWPSPDQDEWQNLDTVFDDHELLQTAFWVYSDKEGTITYQLKDEFGSTDEKNLYQGWNFFSVGLDLVYKDVNTKTLFDERITLESIVGDCDIQKIYYFYEGRWYTETIDINFREENLGSGLLLKTSSNCNMQQSDSQLVSPPGLPGEGDAEVVSKCSAGSIVSCIDKSVNSDKIQLALRSSTAISDLTITIDDCDDEQTVDFEQGETKFVTFNCDVGNSGSLFESVIRTSYINENGLTKTSEGVIVDKIQ